MFLLVRTLQRQLAQTTPHNNIGKVSTVTLGCLHSKKKMSTGKSDKDSKTGMMKENKLENLADKTHDGPKTRSAVETVEQNYKQHYLSMPLDEKRKVYKCKSKYVVVDDVKSWTEHADNIMKKRSIVKWNLKLKAEKDDLLNMKISLWQGDITRLEIDAIVNAANSTLLGGGGVDGAIHSAAGAKLRGESGRLGGCNTGDAKITGGYKLPAKYIIHTVGPIGVDPKALKSAYERSLEVAKENNVRTLAFPCISTGIYGYDVEDATPVAMKTVRDWLLKDGNCSKIDKVIFCVFLNKDVDVYEHNLLEWFPIIDRTDNDPDETTKPKTKASKTNSTKGEKINNSKEKTVKLKDQKKSATNDKRKENKDNIDASPDKKKDLKTIEKNGEVETEQTASQKANIEMSNVTDVPEASTIVKDNDLPACDGAKTEINDTNSRAEVRSSSGKKTSRSPVEEVDGQDEDDKSPAAKKKPPAEDSEGKRTPTEIKHKEETPKKANKL